MERSVIQFWKGVVGLEVELWEKVIVDQDIIIVRMIFYYVSFYIILFKIYILGGVCIWFSFGYVVVFWSGQIWVFDWLFRRWVESWVV